MAKSNAQRQAEYRARKLKDIDGDGQVLYAIVSFRTKNSLLRMASCHGVSQREMIEQVVQEAERRLIDRIGRHADDYYDYKLKLEDGVTK